MIEFIIVMLALAIGLFIISIGDWYETPRDQRNFLLSLGASTILWVIFAISYWLTYFLIWILNLLI